MQELIKKYKTEVLSFKSNSDKETESFRIKYLGKNIVEKEVEIVCQEKHIKLHRPWRKEG